MHARLRLLGPLIVVVAALVLPARAEPPEGTTLEFAIQRNGSQIGTHRISYSRDRTDVMVDHVIDIQVGVGFVDLYRYHLTSRERWRAGRLIGLDAHVNKNGEPLQVMLRAMRHDTTVQSPSGSRTVPEGVVPQSPSWNVFAVAASGARTAMIDAETGVLATVSVTGPAAETITVGGASRATRRYAVHGADNATLWYDEHDLLVKKRLLAPDGSTIEYTLRRGAP